MLLARMQEAEETSAESLSVHQLRNLARSY